MSLVCSDWSIARAASCCKLRSAAAVGILAVVSVLLYQFDPESGLESLVEVEKEGRKRR